MKKHRSTKQALRHNVSSKERYRNRTHNTFVYLQMRVEESTAVLKAIAAGNGKTMPRSKLALPRATSGHPATVLDTFKVPELRKRMVILMFCWFVASMAYYGVSLALEDLPGSLYFNFFLIAVVEFPSYFCTIAVRFHVLRYSALQCTCGSCIAVSYFCGTVPGVALLCHCLGGNENCTQSLVHSRSVLGSVVPTQRCLFQPDT